MKKLTQNEVKMFFEKEGCELLDTYTNIKNSMKYRCICGNISNISFDNFKRGRRCNQCGREKQKEKSKLRIEDVIDFFLKNECTPLFDKYINTHTKLKYICDCGEIGETTFSDFKSGKRCGHCRVKKIQQTMQKHGTQQCSLQQKVLHDWLGGTLNYSFHYFSLDIAFPTEKVYIEYDGSGHDLSVKLGNISKDEFEKKEMKRRYFLSRRGWKEIRIISLRDNLPTEENVEKIFTHSLEHFSKGHSWISYDIDKGVEISSLGEEEYNFGELKRIRTDR